MPVHISIENAFVVDPVRTGNPQGYVVRGVDPERRVPGAIGHFIALQHAWSLPAQEGRGEADLSSPERPSVQARLPVKQDVVVKLSFSR